MSTSSRLDKIVIVDDDTRIRDLLRRYLSQEGFDVLLAEDGRALDRILQRETIDLVVLDLMLPGEDGLSICRRLRSTGIKTPIIMLTAKMEDVDRITGLMTTWASRSTPESCWPAFTPCCAVGLWLKCRVRPLLATARAWCLVTSSWTLARAH